MIVEDMRAARLIAVLAYNLYRTTLVGNPAPIVERAYNRINEPVVGDLVLETSTYYVKLKERPYNGSGLGWLTAITEEPVWSEEEWNEDPGLDHDGEPLPYSACPTEKIYYIEQLSGQGKVRWHNASFITVPTEDLNIWLNGI